MKGKAMMHSCPIVKRKGGAQHPMIEYEGAWRKFDVLASPVAC